MKYKTLFFDLDGTLLDTLNDIVNAINEALLECGYEKQYSYEEGKKLIGSGAHMMAIRAMSFKEYTNEEFVRYESLFLQKYKKKQNETTFIYKGIDDLLIDLKKAGYQLFILTNKPEELAKIVVPLKMDASLFIDVIGASKTNKAKPDPTLFNNCLKKHGINKNDVLYIGDSNVDVELAENALVDCLLVTYGYGDYSESLLKRAKHVAKSVADLRKILL